MDPDTLGKRIAQARRELGVREMRDVAPSDLARSVGVTPQTVYAWEADRKRPSHDAIVSLCTFLGVSPGWLVYGQEPKYSALWSQAPRAAADPAAARVAEPPPRTDAELQSRTGAQPPEDISEQLRTKKPAPKKAAGEQGRGRRRS